MIGLLLLFLWALEWVIPVILFLADWRAGVLWFAAYHATCVAMRNDHE